MARRNRKEINMTPPYLRRVWLDEFLIPDKTKYPYCIPLLKHGLELQFLSPITIFVGENGVGKSTLIEAIAALAGYDESGGGKGYRPVDHRNALEVSGSQMARALRAAWRPRLTDGWFFKAESFFSIARYLDEAAQEPFSGPPPDYLSHSHGEGFLRFFEERCARQGIYFFDEPESALSPSRQIQFLKVLQRMRESARIQVIMATHSPILMACPGATLMGITKHAIEPIRLRDTDHFRLLRAFCDDPDAFVSGALEFDG
jgi:predicted ATPase